MLKVEAFVEKPDAATAEQYVGEDYLWNSGNFFFRADVMQAELQELRAGHRRGRGRSGREGEDGPQFPRLDKDAFGRAPKKSIDYAVMERTDKGRGRPGRYRLVRRRQLEAVWD